MTPATHMKTEAIEKELKAVGNKWTALRSSDEEGGGGSPGEWMWERMGELAHELKRRENGGALQTEIPMQSK
jgi:hypothetical protein